jgi:hypothetical protein
MTGLSTHCPVCGTVIRPGLIPARRDASFSCFRCRVRLEVVASRSWPIVAFSIGFSILFCFALGLGRQTLTPAILTSGLMFYCLGEFLRSVLAVPKLIRTQHKEKLLPQAKTVSFAAPRRVSTFKPYRSKRLP